MFQPRLESFHIVDDDSSPTTLVYSVVHDEPLYSSVSNHHCAICMDYRNCATGTKNVLSRIWSTEVKTNLLTRFAKHTLLNIINIVTIENFNWGIAIPE